MVVTAVLFVVGVVVRKRQPRSKEEDKQWWIEFFGLFVIFALFFVAWGFGLPAVHPLNLGVTRVLFQVIFMVAIIAVGMTMLVVFCVLSPEIREAWKSFFRHFIPGTSKSFDVARGGRQDVEQNFYMTNRSASETKIEDGDDLAKGVSFTFTGNVYENPVAMQESEDSKLSTGPEEKETEVGGAKGKTEGDSDSLVKVDLSAHLEDDQEQTYL